MSVTEVGDVTMTGLREAVTMGAGAAALAAFSCISAGVALAALPSVGLGGQAVAAVAALGAAVDAMPVTKPQADTMYVSGVGRDAVLLISFIFLNNPITSMK